VAGGFLAEPNLNESLPKGLAVVFADNANGFCKKMTG
jgi:hypothetical protein